MHHPRLLQWMCTAVDVELVEHGMFISPQFQHGFYMESAALDNSQFIYSYRCCQHDGVNQSAWTFQTQLHENYLGASPS